MKAIVISRDTLIKYIKPESHKVLISISTPTVPYNSAIPTGWLETLELSFLDVIWDDLNKEQQQELYGMWGDKLKLFDETAASSLLEFIDKHSTRDFVIHCDAGISRSVAVGAFMRDFYGYSVEFAEIGTDKYKNIQVYNTLRRIRYSIQE